jgi:hypothetical protein
LYHAPCRSGSDQSSTRRSSAFATDNSASTWISNELIHGPIPNQYVQTPAASKHVIGQAVDVGGQGADQWLIANGSRFGLCQIYANELWHFELATDAAGTCPALVPNAAG